MSTQGIPARPLALILVAQALLLAAAGVVQADRMNSDAIAYLRIAEYAATGRWNLAVSGYWGPLLSACIAPLLALGVPPLPAARAVLGASAILFTLSTAAVLRAAGIPRGPGLCGVGLAAVAAVPWSVQNISPDLLMSACLGFGVAGFLGATTSQNPWKGWPHAAWLALAYLAKSAALPIALATLALLTLQRLWTDRALARSHAQRFAVWAGLTALLCAPWIAALSAKYGRPTFSTSARIAHAVVGPAGVERSHPFGRQLAPPPPGRLTWWEDPSLMEYPYWSPFDDPAHLRHQARLMLQNLGTLLRLWGTFDAFYTGLLLWLLLAFARDRGALAVAAPLAAAPLCLAAAYVPVYIQLVDQRYVYAAWPWLYALTVRGAERLAARVTQSARLARVGLWIGCASLGIPALSSIALTFASGSDPASVASRILAERLTAAGIRGPVAGSGMLLGSRTGLYLAYRLGVPWHGDSPDPSPAAFKASGATLIVLRRGQPAAARLSGSPLFENLDPVLFSSAQEAETFPIALFRTLADGPPPAPP